MTRQEAVQALVDVGWDRIAAQSMVDTITPGNADQVDESAIQELIATGTISGGLPIDRGDDLGPGGLPAATPSPSPRTPGVTVSVPSRELKNTLASGPGPGDDPAGFLIAAVVQDLDPEAPALTAEQQKAIEETPEGTLADIAALAESLGDAEFNYNWIHQFLTVGSLDSNEALIKFYETYVGIAGAVEELTDETEIVEAAKGILSRGRENELVFQALVDWGTVSGNYQPTQMIDNVNVLDIGQMMRTHNISRDRAVTIGRVANQFDIEPLALAEIWDNFKAEDQVDLGGGLNFRIARRGLAGVAQTYKQGLGLFDQSHLLASLYIVDPGLAQRLRSDPYSLDTADLQRALDAVGGAEGDSSDPQTNWIKQRLAGGFRASADVDKESMRNAVQVLADGWNLTGTEGIVANLTAELVSQAVAKAQASLPNPFGPLTQGVALTDTIQDQAAHVKRRLRETPEFSELFAHLQGGESEEEFVRRFENRSQQVLGDDVVGAVRNAMRTGNVNTIFQQGLHTPVGESSTRFQEILARNAQTFRDLL